MARPLPSQAAALQRRLSLPLLVLYGIGITIGAGIYVRPRRRKSKEAGRITFNAATA